MSKQFWGILLAIVIVFAGIVAFSNHNKNSGGNGSSAKPTNHIEGKGTTGVKLVEYGDYQCPVCAEFYQATKDTVTKYGDKITFQFRNLPLTSLHPNAFAGARAAEAAGKQGKYFEMHDMLYENQDAWSESSSPLTIFSSYAKNLGLNVAKFKSDYASSKVNNSINADMAAFDKTGDEQATPTYYLDGKKVDNQKLLSGGVPSAVAFSKLIDAEIAKKASANNS